MATTTDMAERHGRILGELAEFGLELARKLHGQGMAAETPAETAELSRAFHSVARTVRQTLALEARLAREAARQDHEERIYAERRARDEAVAAERAARAPRDARRLQLGAALENAVEADCEGENEKEHLYEEIAERLLDEAEAPGFLEEDVDDQIARLCRFFGLAVPDRWPEPGFDAAPPPRSPLNGAQGPP